MVYKKDTERMELMINSYSNQILIRQRWKYNWLTKSAMSSWVYSEKRSFHNQLDTIIWNKWGGKFKLRTKGTSDFAKQYNQQNLIVQFDVEWVTSNPHWTVNVTKIPDGTFERSNVRWNAREINLDTEDNELTKKGKFNSVDYYQIPVVHEFGHAIGNVFTHGVGNPDEYNKTSTFFSDKLSVMNVGSTLRERHLNFVIKELNTMVFDTTFYIYDL